MRFPKCIITADGYIGVLYGIEDEQFPVYRFDHGMRIADNREIENGVEEYSEAVKISKERKAARRNR